MRSRNHRLTSALGAALFRGKYSKIAISALILFPLQAQASVTLLFPSANENIATDNPEFVWQDQADATHFQVQVRDVSNGNTKAKWWKRADVCDGSQCRSTVPGVDLNFSKNHWWRARVRTRDGWQAWTAPVSRFHYPDSPAGTIQVNGPQGNTTDATPTFSWNHIDGVSHYRVWAKDFVRNQSAIFENFKSADVCSNGVCEIESKFAFAADDNTDHQWMIRALNTGGWNAWSSRYKFTVEEEAPQAKEVTYPYIPPITTRGNQVLYGGVAKGYAGSSLFWSSFGNINDTNPNSENPKRYYDARTVVELKDKWNSKIIRAAMGVDPNEPFSDAYLSNGDPRDPGLSAAEIAANENVNETLVKRVVEAARLNEMYVIIDWHSHEAHLRTDEAVRFFRAMAIEYKDSNNVIFEIYNEPRKYKNCGDPSQRKPDEYSWNGDIRPYAKRVIEAIRGEGANNLIVVGTPCFSQDVDHAFNNPFDEATYPNIAYSLHFYADSHEGGLMNQARKAMGFNADGSKTITNGVEEVGIPLFVTEWGTTDADGHDGPNNDGGVNEDMTKIWLNFLQSHNISHMNWAINNKNELSSALKVSTGVDNWSNNDLTVSGNLVKAEMLRYNGCLDQAGNTGSSCAVDISNVVLPCVDLDGDGHGWNGIESCPIGNGGGNNGGGNGGGNGGSGVPTPDQVCDASDFPANAVPGVTWGWHQDSALPNNGISCHPDYNDGGGNNGGDGVPTPDQVCDANDFPANAVPGVTWGWHQDSSLPNNGISCHPDYNNGGDNSGGSVPTPDQVCEASDFPNASPGDGQWGWHQDDSLPGNGISCHPDYNIGGGNGGVPTAAQVCEASDFPNASPGDGQWGWHQDESLPGNGISCHPDFNI